MSKIVRVTEAGVTGTAREEIQPGPWRKDRAKGP